MLANILINNYNYGRFLHESIDSALNQTYPHVEVIVVDDGSTDNSREIIASYGGQIIPVLKENGGQASTFNAGFAACSGDVVCFLDADDVFLPEKVALVLKAWQENSHSCLVYHQLQSLNAQNKKIGKPWPPTVWRGDIRNRVERSGGWWPRPTTSGLCCSRSYLERILPMPTEPYKLCADAYVADLAPFLGSVTGISLPLALYRLHGQNLFSSYTNKRERAQRRANQCVVEFKMLQETLHKQLNVPASISLEDHLRYQQHRRAAGESVSIFKIAFTAIKSPALPPSRKVREVVKILTRYRIEE
jgi:glycosyltransferase involved in cell wall biosynthesis